MVPFVGGRFWLLAQPARPTAIRIASIGSTGRRFMGKPLIVLHGPTLKGLAPVCQVKVCFDLFYYLRSDIGICGNDCNIDLLRNFFK